jgi:hypothetical protein
MENKIKSDLEKARALFFSWRLLEAYNIFRRYYDRLPFKPEPEHAQYIGMFIRTMLELGKDFELKFYMGELEKIYARTKSPEIGFQLATVYILNKEPNLKTAKRLLNEVITEPSCLSYCHKARIALAYCYDELDDDRASVRRLIDSITGPMEPELERIVETWRAKVLQANGQPVEAEKKLLSLLCATPPEVDWFAHFVAKHMLGLNYLIQNRLGDAKKVLKELRESFGERSFKSVNANITRLQEMIQEKDNIGTVNIEEIDGEFKLSYGAKILKFQVATLAEKLLVLFIKKKTLSKEGIVKSLYRRTYQGDKDDKLIYYQVHTLRKLLSQLGLPSDAIEKSGTNYRFVPQVISTEAV